MLNNTKSLLFQILFFFSFASENIFAFNQESQTSNVEQEVIDHLIRAETWYWMSRITFNSLEYHQYAEKEYLKAKEKAALLSSPLKENYTNTAEAGFEQTYWRKINAWNSFRNIFPAAWWYSGADSTLDYQDEDHLMLALAGCWAGLEPGLSRQLTPKIFVVPRCNDSEKFEQSTDCGEIKDEFLNMMDVNTRFLGIRDDAVATAIGPEWQEFVKGGNPKPEHIKALGDFHQVENIVVVDIYVIDEFEDPFVAGRIDIQFNQWDTNTMRLMSAGNESGVVVSLRDRRWMVPAWILFLLMISLIYTYIQAKRHRPEKPPGEKADTKYLVPYTIFFIAGYLLSYFAGMLSDQFIPDWGAMALNTDHFLPLAEMWRWTFVHGALIMVGPIILCAYFLLKFGERLPDIGDFGLNNFQNTSTILFTVQAGALGALFSPIIIGWHNEGLIVALGLTFSALILSVAVARPFSSLMGMDRAQYSGLTLFIGILGLIFIIPIGFFRPEWAGHWPIAFVIAQAVLVSIFITYLNGKKRVEKAPQKEPGSVDSNKGSLDHPQWINPETEKIETIVENLTKEADNNSNVKVQTFIIGQIDGIGKTRLMEEIYEGLNAEERDPPWKLVYSTAQKTDEQTQEPYSLISRAFGDAIGISNLANKQSKQAKLREALSGVEGTLTDLPMGIGALFEFGDEDHEASSKDQIIRDITEAVREQIKDYPLAFFLDDIQWADQDSLDLLERMINKLSQSSHNNALVFILGARNEDPISYYFNEPPPFPAEKIELKLFNSDKINEFLKGTGISKFPTWLGEKIVEHIGPSKTTPENIIEFLRALVTKKQDGSFQLPTKLTDEQIKNAIPGKITDQIKIRLKDLHEEDRTILEAAAEIGRSFSITLLAAGLHQDRLILLRSLRRIEDDFRLIIDVQKSDDIMSLESQALRDVLIENSKITAGYESRRELFKEMHYRIAQHMIENDTNFNPIEIMQHCILSGDRLAEGAINYGILAIESATNKQTWKTVVSIIQKIKDKGSAIIKYASQKQLNKIDFFEAQALHGIGLKSEKASDILEGLFSSCYLPKYKLFYTWFVNEFRKRDFEKIINQVEKIEKEDLADNTKCNIEFKTDEEKNQHMEKYHKVKNPIVAPLCEFYRNLSSFNLIPGGQKDENKIQGAKELVQSLKNTRTELESLHFEKTNNRDHLLSMIIQETANKFAFWSVDGDALEAFDDSMRLKEKSKDLEGLGINHGMRSSYFVEVTKEYEKAIEFRVRSLLCEEKRGNEPNQCFSLNKLAEILHDSANQDKSPTQETYQLAFDFALSAYKIASEDPKDKKMTFNYIFSAINVFNYGKKLGKFQSDMKLPELTRETKLDVDSNNEIIINDTSMKIIDLIKEMEATLEPWDWLSNVQKLSKTAVDAETTS
jgi:hypothetical protein